MASSDDDDYFNVNTKSSNLHSLFQNMDMQTPTNYNSNLFFVPPKQPKQLKKTNLNKKSEGQQPLLLDPTNTGEKPTSEAKRKSKQANKENSLIEGPKDKNSDKISVVQNNVLNLQLPEPTPLVIEEKPSIANVSHETKTTKKENNIEVAEQTCTNLIKCDKNQIANDIEKEKTKTKTLQKDEAIVTNNCSNEIKIKHMKSVKPRAEYDKVIEQLHTEKQQDHLNRPSKEDIGVIQSEEYLQLRNEMLTKFEQLNITVSEALSIEHRFNDKFERLEKLIKCSSVKTTDQFNATCDSDEKCQLEAKIEQLEKELKIKEDEKNNLEYLKSLQQNKIIEFQKDIKKAMSKLFTRTSDLLQNCEASNVDELLTEDFKITTYQIIGKAKELGEIFEED